MRNSVRCLSIVCASLLLGSTGCTIKATLNQTTDTTSNITGTTSGAAWWSEDGQIKPDFKATAFVAFNQANLSQDLATGSGEYLGIRESVIWHSDRSTTGIFFHRPSRLCPDDRSES